MRSPASAVALVAAAVAVAALPAASQVIMPLQLPLDDQGWESVGIGRCVNDGGAIQVGQGKFDLNCRAESCADYVPPVSPAPPRPASVALRFALH